MSEDDAPPGRNDDATLRLKNRIENGWTAENYEEKETLMSEDENREKLERLVVKAMEDHFDRELALGFVRYERLRKMNPNQFAKLHEENMKGKPFDHLVDEAVLAWRARA
jgi:hypothetical protein